MSSIKKDGRQIEPAQDKRGARWSKNGGGGLTIVRCTATGGFAWFRNVLGSLDIDEEEKCTDAW